MCIYVLVGYVCSPKSLTHTTKNGNADDDYTKSKQRLLQQTTDCLRDRNTIVTFIELQYTAFVCWHEPFQQLCRHLFSPFNFFNKYLLMVHIYFKCNTVLYHFKRIEHNHYWHEVIFFFLQSAMLTWHTATNSWESVNQTDATFGTESLATYGNVKMCHRLR